MTRFLWLVTSVIIVINCAGTANVEMGMNDEGTLAGVYGDLRMRILVLELFDGADYKTLWQGPMTNTISILSTDFISITNGFEVIEPGSYSRVRVSVDSLQYVNQSLQIMLVDTALTFIADAFSAIEIDDGDERQLLINIASPNWFDTDSVKIRSGHQPFEGAGLKIYYPIGF